MPNPISNIIRLSSLWFNKSKEPTSILPLTEIKTAVILMDSSEKGAEKTASFVVSFFGKHKINCTILWVSQDSLNAFGRLKRAVRYPQGKAERKEDLFISLLSGGTYVEQFEAHCSRAKFKLGRSLFRSKVYDLMIVDPLGEYNTQEKVFMVMCDFLAKIK